MGRSGCNSARRNRRNRRARNGPCQRTRIHTVATGVIDNSPAPSRLVNADALGEEQGRDTKMLSFCGIDVSKDRLDVMVLPDEYSSSVPGFKPLMIWKRLHRRAQASSSISTRSNGSV